MDTLIKNGTLVNATDIMVADIWIEKGLIVAITDTHKRTFNTPKRVIDATGHYVFPGGVDVHTHLDMPFGGTYSIDDFETGTLAAAYGGTTSIVDFSIQEKGKTLKAALDTWHHKAKDKTFIDYGFHMIITDINPYILNEMQDMVLQGVSSFKLFMAYPNVLYLDDQAIFRAMLRSKEIGALICLHAEAGLPIDVLIERALEKGNTAPIYHALTRPEVAESTGVERAIALAEMSGASIYIVHLTSRRALERVIEGRNRGIPVFAETCPQYLFCNEDHLKGTDNDPFLGAKYVCTPPLRPLEHQNHLWRGLNNYNLQVVSTDHCPFCMNGQKDIGQNDFSKIPNGMPGIETRMYLLYEAVVQKKISLNRFVDITSTAPAKIFGMYPQKGSLNIGSDADIVVWDPNQKMVLNKENLHMNVDYSPYEEHQVPGSPAYVFSRGELLIKKGELLAKKGRGKYIKRSRFLL